MEPTKSKHIIEKAIRSFIYVVFLTISMVFLWIARIFFKIFRMVFVTLLRHFSEKVTTVFYVKKSYFDPKTGKRISSLSPQPPEMWIAFYGILTLCLVSILAWNFGANLGIA